MTVLTFLEWISHQARVINDSRIQTGGMCPGDIEDYDEAAEGGKRVFRLLQGPISISENIQLCKPACFSKNSF